MKYFLRSLLLVVLSAVETAVMFWNFKTMITIVIVGPALLMLTVSSFAMVIFRDLEKIPGTVAESESTENEGDEEC